MSWFRTAVVGVVVATAVLLNPGAAAANSSDAAPQHCEQMWIWWIPLPCL
ncbi:hypothetical protein ACI79C_21010 [Geodermatophilus sp. SYSU D00697]